MIDNIPIADFQFSELVSVDGAELLTFPQDNPLISRELGLHRLGGEVLPALPQVPLGAAQAAEPPEVGPVAPGCFGEGVLHAGELLGSVDPSGIAETDRRCQAR